MDKNLHGNQELMMEVTLIPLSKKLEQTYIAVGTKAYNQHYLHLWELGNSSPYIASSFTKEVLMAEYQNPNTSLFVIHANELPVGVLKLTNHKGVGCFTDSEALLLDKIYLLRECAGKGIGSEVLKFVEAFAAKQHKKIVWLDTMQKGPALGFYLKNGFQIHSETSLKFPTTIAQERPMYILYKQV